MAYDRFLIAPLNTGLETDLKSWMTPDDSFAELNNAYVFRGRVRKRFGTQFSGINDLTSRLRMLVGTTDGNGDSIGAITVPGATFKIGQMLSVGDSTFNVVVLGNPANLLRSDGLADVATLDTTTGALVIRNSIPTSNIYFYMTEPVMGFTMYEAGNINNHTAYAFDTRYAYRFAGGQWIQFGPSVGNRWHGTNTDFFWSCNWHGATDFSNLVFTSNYYFTPDAAPGANDDPIWYYDGTTWTAFTPAVRIADPVTNQVIRSAKIILPFKNRLILLNTVETDGSAGAGINRVYTNRCRFSHAGNPLATTAWWEPNVFSGGNYATGGGYIDAPTKEDIVSAHFIKDRLIVYFERSTWELAYTGNQVLPFVWQKLNTELGVEATFSVVPFDKVVLGIGTTGVHACNGSNVERIDEKIPDKVFDLVHKSDAVKRIHGIRDYVTEAVYWAAPMNSADSATMYPDKVLVYNYRNQSWAFNDDSFTAFGYFEQQDGRIWATSIFPWSSAGFAWGSGVSRAQFRSIIAGNQQGWVLAINPEKWSNAPALHITNMTALANLRLTIYDHNLITGDFIKITNIDPINIGSTDGAGAIAVGVISPVFKIGQYFQIGADTFTVGALGNPANLTRSDGLPDVATLDTDTGALIINNAAINTPVYFYPRDLNENIYQVTRVDANNVDVSANNFVGTYAGGGIAARVSRIDMRTKQWNPYVKDGRNFYLAKVDFCTQRTTGGEITVDYFPSSTDLSLITESAATGSQLGNNILETTWYPLVPLEQYQERTWHPIYFQGEGQFVQLRIYLGDSQMINPTISESSFELEGLILYCRPTSSRLI